MNAVCEQTISTTILVLHRISYVQVGTALFKDQHHNAAIQIHHSRALLNNGYRNYPRGGFPATEIKKNQNITF